MNRNANRKENSKGTWIGLAVSLLVIVPEVMVPVAFFGGIIWLVIKAAGKQKRTPKSSAKVYTTRQERFDECPQSLFCRHKDKAEHHVRRGREIDPWDRPDIDISKYQRNH